MSSDHIKVKHRLQDGSIRTFNQLLDELMLSEEIKSMLRMIYIDHKSLDYIAGELNVSISTVKAWHIKALKQIARII